MEMSIVILLRFVGALLFLVSLTAAAATSPHTVVQISRNGVIKTIVIPTGKDFPQDVSGGLFVLRERPQTMVRGYHYRNAAETRMVIMIGLAFLIACLMVMLAANLSKRQKPLFPDALPSASASPDLSAHLEAPVAYPVIRP